jgi:hypothetical protein
MSISTLNMLNENSFMIMQFEWMKESKKLIQFDELLMTV